MWQPADYRSEDRFFEALSGDFLKPYWWHGFERTGAKFDALGVDALIKVRYPGGDIIRVPVQVKGSQDSVYKYYCNHPEALRARVIVIVVHRDGHFEEIRKLLFRDIEQRRSSNTHFDAFIQGLYNRELSPYIKKQMWLAQRERCRSVLSVSTAR